MEILGGIIGIVLLILFFKYWKLILLGIAVFSLLSVLVEFVKDRRNKPKNPPSFLDSNGEYAVQYHYPEKMNDMDSMDGHTFERWCARLLRQNGFTNVSVTPGSNDQGIDVLAYKDGLRYGVQCKCYSNDLGNKPVQEATAGRAIYGCDIAVVMTNRYFTKGAVEAAKATGVCGSGIVTNWHRWCRTRRGRMRNEAN